MHAGFGEGRAETYRRKPVKVVGIEEIPRDLEHPGAVRLADDAGDLGGAIQRSESPGWNPVWNQDVRLSVQYGRVRAGPSERVAVLVCGGNPASLDFGG